MRIYGDEPKLYQWDTGRRVTHDALSPGQTVHFYNRNLKQALVMTAYQLDGEVVADIPNILLQSALPIHIYLVCADQEAQFTHASYRFLVIPRPKPDDYVYTETEVLNFANLEKRVSALEKGGVPGDKVDLTGYATEQFVEDKIAEAQLSGGNVSLTADQINALDGMFKIASFTEDPTAAYTAFKTAFGIIDSGGSEEPDVPVVPGEPDEPDTPEVTLSSISVTYSGGDVPVGTAVTDLTGIVVTAHYSDGTSETVTEYTLSGEIAEGSNTITVSYSGKTTTFDATGVVESVALRGFQLSAPPTSWSDVEGWTRKTNVATNYKAYWYNGKVAQSGEVYFRTLMPSAGIGQYCNPEIYITADADPLADIENVNLTKLEADEWYSTFAINGAETAVCVEEDGSVSTDGDGKGFVLVGKFTIPDGHVGLLTLGNSIQGTALYNIRYVEGWLTLFYDDPRNNITVTEVTA